MNINILALKLSESISFKTYNYLLTKDTQLIKY